MKTKQSEKIHLILLCKLYPVILSSNKNSDLKCLHKVVNFFKIVNINW